MKTSSAIARIVPSIPAVISKLELLRKELSTAKTYIELKRIEREAKAIKLLYREVITVKHKAELVILLSNRRIAQEIENVPKASGQPPKSISRRMAKNTLGRAATGIPKDTRSRIAKLLSLTEMQLKSRAKQIQDTGGDATPRAILTTIKSDDIKKQRAAYLARADRGGTIGDLRQMAKEGKKFSVIYADPPWEFRVYSGKGKQRSAERHYDTSSLAAIQKLPIESLAADKCALFLWCVMPELPGALEVIKAWGFEYKTVGFVWIKQNRNGSGIFTGMGYWTRANAEICLLATRGSPQRIEKNVHQVILAPVRKHSEKPEETSTRIERLLNGPYLELFGRKARAGWTVWGNEIAPLLREAAE